MSAPPVDGPKDPWPHVLSLMLNYGDIHIWSNFSQTRKQKRKHQTMAVRKRPVFPTDFQIQTMFTPLGGNSMSFHEVLS